MYAWLPLPVISRRSQLPYVSQPLGLTCLGCGLCFLDICEIPRQVVFSVEVVELAQRLLQEIIEAWFYMSLNRLLRHYVVWLLAVFGRMGCSYWFPFNMCSVFGKVVSCPRLNVYLLLFFYKMVPLLLWWKEVRLVYKSDSRLWFLHWLKLMHLFRLFKIYAGLLNWVF